MLLHLAVERRTVQAENLRGFLLVPVGPLKRLENRHLLDFGQRSVRRHDEIGQAVIGKLLSGNATTLAETTSVLVQDAQGRNVQAWFENPVLEKAVNIWVTCEDKLWMYVGAYST